jgi:hypothetical protein
MVRAFRPAVSLGAVLVVASLWPAGRADAQLSADQVLKLASAPPAPGLLPPDTFGGQLGLGKIGNDWFMTLALGINFDRDNWGIGLQVPLRLRITDTDPTSHPKDYFGVLRHEDWDDQPADFLRLIRYVYIGQVDKKGAFYIRVGELSGLTVGHGTIVSRYFNGLDLNTVRIGTDVAVNIGPVGAEAVIGDVAHLSNDVTMAGIRATLKPLELFMPDVWPLNRLVFGASLFTDPSAPVTLARDPTDPSGATIQLDASGRPVVATRRAVAVAGADLGLEILEGAPLSITPYIDFNKITAVANGYGLHMGILWGLRFPVLIDTLTADIKTEYRRVSGDYLSPYFDTAHEIDRFSFPPGTGATTKLGYLAASSTVAGRNGLYFDIFAGLPKYIYVGGEYLKYDGQQNDGTLRLSLNVPALSFIQLSAMYYRVGIGPLTDLFKLDNRSAVVAAAKIPLYYVFTLNLQWWRLWKADPTGNFVATDDWSVGVGFNLQI